jgi:hypothetical protein
MQASERFRFSSIALLLLTISTILLLLCVQCGFWARHHYTRPEEATAWWPDYEESAQRRRMLVEEQQRSYALFRRWSAWARRAYSFGVVVLLLGIMAALGELLWLASASQRTGKWLPRSVADWFNPRAS